MTQEQSQIRYSRVTLAISGSADAADMIEAAGRLARAAGARLHGLLLEDKALFDLARLPFSASIVPGPLPAREPLTARRLEAAFAKQERILRQLLAATAGRGDLDWTFERHRGAMSDLVLSAAEDELLLVCGDAATDEAEAAFASVGSRRGEIGGFGILKPQALKKPGPIMAIMGGGPGARQTVMLAQRIAHGLGRPFEFLVLNGDPAEMDSWMKAASGDGTAAQSFFELEHSETVLQAEIARAGPSLIVGDLCNWPFDEPATGDRVIRTCGCPVVLLRCPDADRT